MKFIVEGRYFPDSLQAFTFAWIQADRMLRPVEVHTNVPGRPWHATAQPSNYVRSHRVTSKTAPMKLHPVLEAVAG